MYLLLTSQKFDVFGRRQIRRDLVATVSSKVGRLPLPDIISTNVPRSWTLCKCSSRRNSPRTNFVKGFSPQSLLRRMFAVDFRLTKISLSSVSSRWQSAGGDITDEIFTCRRKFCGAIKDKSLALMKFPRRRIVLIEIHKFEKR